MFAFCEIGLALVSLKQNSPLVLCLVRDSSHVFVFNLVCVKVALRQCVSW